MADPLTAFALGLTQSTASAVVAASAFYKAGAFLGGTIIGNLLLNVALSAIFAPRGGAAPDIEAARINTRLDNPERFQAIGTAVIGGNVGVFHEFDEDGNFWYIVTHADSESQGQSSYILGGIEVSISDGTDGFTAGDVITDDFCLTDGNDIYEGSGTRVPHVRIWTVSPSVGNVYGAKPTEFTDAFSSVIPADFHLAGVTYSIVKIKSLSINDRHKIYRWDGSLRIGEPSVVLIDKFSRAYDPREAGHDIDDPDTWTFASVSNPVIAWAWSRTQRFGRTQGMADISWSNITAQANICDELVVDRNGDNVARYACGLVFKDTTRFEEIEKEILATCDGQLRYDGEGKIYVEVGKYAAPSLEFSEARDIVAASTETVDNGESPVDGVVVRYISPDHSYQKVESAPWNNPEYYSATREPIYTYLDVLGCQDHNQAFRLAGAYGARMQPPKKASIVTGIKGFLAHSERAITLNYDDEFDGIYEIATPVSRDPQGHATSFSVVPLETNRWDGAGQSEGPPPAAPSPLSIDQSLVDATNVSISAAPISGGGVRLEATFSAPSRLDRFYVFRYADDGDTVYEYFQTDMDELKAYSAVVSDGQSYDVQYQTRTAGGRAGEWSDIVDVVASSNTTAPIALTSFTATGAVSSVDLSLATGNDENQAKVLLYRGTTTDFGSASLFDTVIIIANDVLDYTDTPLSAGTYYYWAVPANSSNVTGPSSGPESAIVT
jgi:hypothetical protein